MPEADGVGGEMLLEGRVPIVIRNAVSEAERQVGLPVVHRHVGEGIGVVVLGLGRPGR